MPPALAIAATVPRKRLIFSIDIVIYHARDRKFAVFGWRSGDRPAGEGEAASILARHDEAVLAAALAQGGLICFLDTMRRNGRGSWSPARRDQEFLDGRARTSDESLHRSVAAVAHPAVEMQSPGLAGDKNAIAYALHGAFDDDASDACLCDRHVFLI
jgi:hypothetical protein